MREVQSDLSYLIDDVESVVNVHSSSQMPKQDLEADISFKRKK